MDLSSEYEIVIIAAAGFLFLVAAAALVQWAKRNDHTRLQEDVIDEHVLRIKKLEDDKEALAAKYSHTQQLLREAKMKASKPAPAPAATPPPRLPVMENENRNGAKPWRKSVVGALLRMYGLSAAVTLLRRWYNKWVRWLVASQRVALRQQLPHSASHDHKHSHHAKHNPLQSTSPDAYASFAHLPAPVSPPLGAGGSPLRPQPQAKYHTANPHPSEYSAYTPVHPSPYGPPQAFAGRGVYPYPSAHQYPSGVMYVNRQ